MDNRKIELPNDLDLAERIELCQKIIDDNYEYFEYKLPTSTQGQIDSSEKVVIRLSVMGDYIYAASPSPDKPILSHHAEKQIIKHEVPLEIS